MRFIVTALIFFNIAFQSSFSQLQGQHSTLSLKDCMEIALKRNTDIRLSEQRVNASSADLTNAFGSFLPSINLNAGFTRQYGGNNVNINGQIIPIPQENIKPNSYNMGAQAQLPIFTGFSREANYSAAKNNLESQYLQMEQTAELVKINIYKQYVDVVEKMQIVKLRRQDFEMGKNELERIRANYEAGIIPIADVYAQEAELGSRELQIVAAENSVELAKATLMTTMGVPPDLSWQFLESSIPSTIEDREIKEFRTQYGSINQVVELAMQQRFDYRASNNNISAAESGITAAKSGYLPTLAAYGGWSWANYELDNVSDLGRSYVGLNISLPLFDNFNTNARIQNAELSLASRQIEKENLEFNIRTSIQSAFLNLEAAEKQIDISKRALKSAQQNHDAVQERYRVGISTLLELNEANRQLLTAQLNSITYVYSYLKAQKQILFEIGKFD